jgi:dipeptidyl aminopeptidase/acylaminoacyl peptidase
MFGSSVSTRIPLQRTAAVALFVFCTAAVGLTQLQPKDVLTMVKFSSDPKFTVSSDEREVAYTVEKPMPTSGTREEHFSQALELWVTDLVTRQSQRVCCTASRGVFSPSWSPDGRLLAYYRSDSYSPWNSDLVLALWDRNTGESRDVLKAGVAAISSLHRPYWTADGQSLAFFSKSQEVSAAPIKVQEADGTNSSIRVLHSSKSDPSAQGVATTQDGADNSQAARDFYHASLSIVEVKSGKIKVLLKDIYPQDCQISPDRKVIAYSNFRQYLPGSFYAAHDIYVFNLETSEQRQVASGIVTYATTYDPFSWSPDGRFLAFPHQRSKAEGEDFEGFAAFVDYVVADLKTNTSFRLNTESAEYRGDARRVVWSANGESLSVVRGNAVETFAVKGGTAISRISIPNKELLDIVSLEGGQKVDCSGSDCALLVRTRDLPTLNTGFWKVWPKSAKTEKLVEEPLGVMDYGFQVLLPKASRVLFVAESVDRAAELYDANLQFTDTKRVSNLNPDLPSAVVGGSQLIRWKRSDGVELEGALLLPAGYRKGQRYPLIVSVYPKDHQADVLNQFGMEDGGTCLSPLLLAQRGYAIFVPNAKVEAKTFIRDVTSSVLSGVDKVVDLGIADPERIGVTGQSAGGDAVLDLLVSSNRFKAGVMVSGMGNLISGFSYDYTEKVIEQEFNATPWENRDVLIENSAYFYLNRVETPLLIMHGSLDTGVPVHLGEEVFTGLRRLGKEATFVEYEGEDHIPSYYTAEHQLDYLNRLFNWFDTYLKRTSRASDVASCSVKR